MLGANERLVSLSSVGNGAAIEAFDREMRKVLEDIGDRNVKVTDVREVHLIVKIAPEEDGARAKVGITTKAKFGSRKIHTTNIWLERTNDGAVVAVEETRGQELPFGESGRNNSHEEER